VSNIVEVTRGALVESRHVVHVAVAHADRGVVTACGDRTMVSFVRSAIKMFQALPLAEDGVIARWGLTTEEVALCTASHNAEPFHVAAAQSILAKAGVTVDALACGPHPPMFGPAASELERVGIAPGRIHNNCSGKHLGMLALATHLSADRGDYQLPHHRVQTAISETISVFSGVREDAVAIGIDGCGVPTFGTSIYHLALAFARLMDPSSLSGRLPGGAEGIRSAMTANPYLVAGRGRLDTDLMQTAGGGLVAKGGASGVECVGLPGGVGLAVKIEDGATGPPPAPGGVVTTAALLQFGFLDEAQAISLSAHARPLLRNVAGQVVGKVRPVFDLVLQ